jgi:hypothetical protein
MRCNASKYLWIFCIVSVLLPFTSCFFWNKDGERVVHRITKDFYLEYYFGIKEQSIFQTRDTVYKEYGGVSVIKATVFAVGNDESFVIVKQHPNMEQEINDRLFKSEQGSSDFVLKDLGDSIYLSKDDKVYSKNGKWYHKSNGWNPPDSLCPNKKITNYYILDIRNYKIGDYDSYKMYQFDNKADFEKKRQELGVSDKLDFTMVSKEVE